MPRPLTLVFTLGLRHTFVGRQRALALVHFLVIQTPPLRSRRCRKNLPLGARSMIQYTPKGLPIPSSINTFEESLFNEGNDHNPHVARRCVLCCGIGQIGVHPDFAEPYEECNQLGCLDEPVPYFDNDAAPLPAGPNKHGWVKCPGCGTRFMLTDKSAWTGWRCACGQRIAIQQTTTSAPST